MRDRDDAPTFERVPPVKRGSGFSTSLLAIVIFGGAVFALAWWIGGPTAEHPPRNAPPESSAAAAAASAASDASRTQTAANARAVAEAGVRALEGRGVPDFPTTPQLDAVRDQVRKEPDDPWTWQELGYSYALIHRDDLALDALASARAHDDHTNGLHSRMGWAYFNLGHADEALREWQQAYELSGGTTYYDDYCLALGKWANGNNLDALTYYQNAVNKDATFGNPATFEERIQHFTARERRVFEDLFDAWRKSYAIREGKPTVPAQANPAAAPADASEPVVPQR